MRVKRVNVSAEDLNSRIDTQIMMLERMSILLEEAKADSAITLSVDSGEFEEMMESLLDYEALVEHLKDSTDETVGIIRAMIYGDEQCYGEVDMDIDPADEVEEDEDAEEEVRHRAGCGCGHCK